MNIARILYPVKVLGPGDRIGLWLCGCSRKCKGCSNPELWAKRPEYEITPDEVFSLIQKISSSHQVDGFTISGGEPMDQPEDLASLLSLIKPISEDTLVYTGYRLEELQAKDDQATKIALDSIAVLIDGPYMEEQNDNSLLRGSSNQRILVLRPEYNEQYHRYLSETQNQIQNFSTANGIVSVGIHHSSFSI